MNFKMMGKFLAQIIAIEAAFLLPALTISRIRPIPNSCRFQ